MLIDRDDFTIGDLDEDLSIRGLIDHASGDFTIGFRLGFLLGNQFPIGVPTKLPRGNAPISIAIRKRNFKHALTGKSAQRQSAIQRDKTMIGVCHERVLIDIWK